MLSLCLRLLPGLAIVAGGITARGHWSLSGHLLRAWETFFREHWQRDEVMKKDFLGKQQSFIYF